MPTKKTDELTPVQMNCIKFMLEGWKQTDIADELSISPETISRWKQIPIFQATYNDLKMQKWETIADRFDHLSLVAADRLEELLSHESPGIVLKACRLILSNRSEMERLVTNPERIRQSQFLTSVSSALSEMDARDFELSGLS